MAEKQNQAESIIRNVKASAERIHVYIKDHHQSDMYNEFNTSYAGRVLAGFNQGFNLDKKYPLPLWEWIGPDLNDEKKAIVSNFIVSIFGPMFPSNDIQEWSQCW